MCKKNIKIEKQRPHPIENIMESVMSRMRTLVDTSIVVGEPIFSGEGICIIPLSRVSMGFVSGGGEYSENKKFDKPFAGGAGAGYSVSPVGFAVVSGTNVEIIKLEPNEIFEKLVGNIPALISLIKEKIKKEKCND